MVMMMAMQGWTKVVSDSPVELVDFPVEQVDFGGHLLYGQACLEFPTACFAVD